MALGAAAAPPTLLRTPSAASKEKLANRAPRGKSAATAIDSPRNSARLTVGRFFVPPTRRRERRPGRRDPSRRARATTSAHRQRNARSHLNSGRGAACKAEPHFCRWRADHALSARLWSGGAPAPGVARRLRTRGRVATPGRPGSGSACASGGGTSTLRPHSITQCDCSTTDRKHENNPAPGERCRLPADGGIPHRDPADAQRQTQKPPEDCHRPNSATLSRAA